VATELAWSGANVVILSRNEEKLRKAIEQLDTSKGQTHSYIVADLAAPETVRAVVSNVVHGKAFHILVNNAGGPPSAPLIETNASEIERAFRTHVISSHLLVQTLVEGMKREGFGRIVNILSTSVKQPINGLGISNLVRAAMANWAKTLANEISDSGITINNVLPGFINTDRMSYLIDKQATDQNRGKDEILRKTVAGIPAGRIGEPLELAAAVAFLCSPAAAYINGINLPVDGGRTASL
jgi:3-oxoacyl-[acyl-carrier protein] reductase